MVGATSAIVTVAVGDLEVIEGVEKAGTITVMVAVGDPRESNNVKTTGVEIAAHVLVMVAVRWPNAFVRVMVSKVGVASLTRDDDVTDLLRSIPATVDGIVCHQDLVEALSGRIFGMDKFCNKQAHTHTAANNRIASSLKTTPSYEGQSENPVR
jgi:hypothetical protein